MLSNLFSKQIKIILLDGSKLRSYQPTACTLADMTGTTFGKHRHPDLVTYACLMDVAVETSKRMPQIYAC